VTDNEQQLVPVSRIWGDLLASVSSRLLIAACTLFALIFGCFVGVRGLGDPDTCWLLSLGRYIFQHHSLPATDPYSFTFALQDHRPFVMYQWLSELLFFCAYQVSAEVSLLVFAAVLLAVAFWIIPLRCQSPEMPRCILLPLAMVGSVASCFHFLVRPEIFSYVCLAICIWLLHKALAVPRSAALPESAGVPPASSLFNSLRNSIDLLLVVAMTALFAVWANLHTGFVIGLVVQLIALIAFIAIVCTQAKESSQRRSVVKVGAVKVGAVTAGAVTVAAALVCSTAATLLNPQGFQLWTYLPGLFFAPFNFLIQELRPLGAADLHEFTYYPYLLFVAVIAFALVRSVLFRTKENGAAYCFAFLSTFVFLIAGFVCRRLIPFAVLIALMNLSLFWIHPSKKIKVANFGEALEARLSQIVDIRGLAWSVTLIALIVCSTIFGATKVVKAQIPQAGALALPSGAFAYLEKNLPGGRVFNDAQYGDIIIWRRLPVPVFIDTRYDMYGTGLIADYLCINRCDAGWEQLLDKYEIAWIFIPQKSAPLAEKLSNNVHWQQVYADKVCSIFKRISR